MLTWSKTISINDIILANDINELKINYKVVEDNVVFSPIFSTTLADVNGTIKKII